MTGNRTVVAGGQEFRASRGLVLATGTQPAVPLIDGLAGTPYWTNHETLEAREAPASLTVAGGGAVGVELAQAFARFFSQLLTSYNASLPHPGGADRQLRVRVVLHAGNVHDDNNGYFGQALDAAFRPTTTPDASWNDCGKSLMAVPPL